MTENSMAEDFSLLGISLGMILLRLVSRISLLGIRKLQLDDYLMALAGCFYTAEVVIAYYIWFFKGVTNGTMTDEKRVTLSPDSQEYHDRISGSKSQLVGWMTYALVLWMLKACMLCFYTRLTDKVSNMAIRIKMGAFLIPITFLAAECVTLFGCSPVRKHWQINPDPGDVCHPAHSLPTIYTVLALNVSTDFYLMYIPLPMVLGAHLPLKKKLALIAMFSGGLFITVAGKLRCVIIVMAGANGPQQAASWSVRESCIAIWVSNIPMIYPYIARRYHDITSTKDSSQPEIGQGESPHRSFKKKLSPYSIPQTTFSESRDRINKMPVTAVDIEAGSEAGSLSEGSFGNGRGDIRVVTTIGVKSSAN